MSVYTAREHGKIIKQVLINGANVTSLCFEANTDENSVSLYVRDENGEIVTCKNYDGETVLLQSVSYGRVEVILHDLPQKLIDIGGVLED